MSEPFEQHTWLCNVGVGAGLKKPDPERMGRVQGATGGNVMLQKLEDCFLRCCMERICRQITGKSIPAPPGSMLAC